MPTTGKAAARGRAEPLPDLSTKEGRARRAAVGTDRRASLVRAACPALARVRPGADEPDARADFFGAVLLPLPPRRFACLVNAPPRGSNHSVHRSVRWARCLTRSGQAR